MDSLHAPHAARGRFFNPWRREGRSFLDLLRWKLAASAHARRGGVLVPRVANDGRSLTRRAPSLETTWIGHASFALHLGSTVVLTDPHFGPRALGPRRISPPGIPLAAVPEKAVAALSHNHYDHLDRWTLARLPRSTAWVVPLGLGRTLRSFGYREVVELDWWQEAEVGGVRFTALPAQHWSRRLSQSLDTTLWASYRIELDGARIFFAGDSGYFPGFREFGSRAAAAQRPIDLALLPIGAYEPRWFMGIAHMNPEEALDAFEELGARTMIAMHWGAFDLTDEAPDEPPRELARRLAARPHLARRVRVAAVGETISASRPSPAERPASET